MSAWCGGVRTDESLSANKCGSGKPDGRKALSIELSVRNGSVGWCRPTRLYTCISWQENGEESG
jgi:hypothetical protein